MKVMNSCSILEIVELISRCIENLQALVHGKGGLSYVSIMKSYHGNSRYQEISCSFEVLTSFPVFYGIGIIDISLALYLKSGVIYRLDCEYAT